MWWLRVDCYWGLDIEQRLFHVCPAGMFKTRLAVTTYCRRIYRPLGEDGDALSCAVLYDDSSPGSTGRESSSCENWMGMGTLMGGVSSKAARYLRDEGGKDNIISEDQRPTLIVLYTPTALLCWDGMR